MTGHGSAGLPSEGVTGQQVLIRTRQSQAAGLSRIFARSKSARLGETVRGGAPKVCHHIPSSYSYPRASIGPGSFRPRRNEAPGLRDPPPRGGLRTGCRLRALRRGLRRVAAPPLPRRIPSLGCEGTNEAPRSALGLEVALACLSPGEVRHPGEGARKIPICQATGYSPMTSAKGTPKGPLAGIRSRPARAGHRPGFTPCSARHGGIFFSKSRAWLGASLGTLIQGQVPFTDSPFFESDGGAESPRLLRVTIKLTSHLATKSGPWLWAGPRLILACTTTSFIRGHLAWAFGPPGSVPT